MYPRIHGLAVLAGVWLRTTETEITSTQWAHVAWEGLHLSLLDACLGDVTKILYI